MPKLTQPLTRRLTMPLAVPLDSPLAWRSGGGPAYDPDADIKALDLWAGGGKGGWWHPGDPAVVFQDAAGTVPALDTNSVWRINDKSPNVNHWLAPSSNARGVLNVSTQKWIKLDGVDDGYGVTTTLASGMSLYAVADRVTDTNWLLAAGVLNGSANIVAGANASLSYDVGTGTPSIRVNTVSRGGTRQNLLDACPANTPVVIVYEGLNLSSWNNLFSGNYPAFEFGGRLFEYIACPNQTTTKRNALEQALAARHGITF